MDVATVADRELDGLDPYEIMRAEAARIEAFLVRMPPDDWAAPTGCDEWNRHDLVAHLAGGEQYNHACLDGALDDLMAQVAAAGVTDVDGFNRWCVAARRGVADATVLAEWRAAVDRTIGDLAARDGGDLPTMVGPYPARWQAFHLAAELATHADDLGVEIDRDSPDRARWRARATRFFLAESHPDIDVRSAAGVDGGATTVTADGTVATLDDATLVAAANRRLRDPDAISTTIRDAVALM